MDVTAQRRGAAAPSDPSHHLTIHTYLTCVCVGHSRFGENQHQFQAIPVTSSESVRDTSYLLFSVHPSRRPPNNEIVYHRIRQKGGKSNYTKHSVHTHSDLKIDGNLVESEKTRNKREPLKREVFPYTAGISAKIQIYQLAHAPAR